MTAPVVWQVIWIGADGRVLGACGHRHATADEATRCPFEPASLPEVCAGLVRQVRDPEYRAWGERRPGKVAMARQLELELGA